MRLTKLRYNSHRAFRHINPRGGMVSDQCLYFPYSAQSTTVCYIYRHNLHCGTHILVCGLEPEAPRERIHTDRSPGLQCFTKWESLYSDMVGSNTWHDITTYILDSSLVYTQRGSSKEEFCAQRSCHGSGVDMIYDDDEIVLWIIIHLDKTTGSNSLVVIW